MKKTTWRNKLVNNSNKIRSKLPFWKNKLNKRILKKQKKQKKFKKWMNKFKFFKKI